jgi:polar amino acid transport system substrate-binding protein
VIHWSAYCSDEEIHLVGFNVPRFVVDEDNGEFIVLAKKIAKQAGIKLKISIAPPQRTLLMLKQGRIDGYFPALKALKKYIPKLETADTVPFYYKKDYLFTNVKTQKSVDSKFLKDKKLCLTSGYPYDDKFVKNQNFVVESSASDYGCLRMLASGRVDYFMCELMTGFSALNEISEKDKNQIQLIEKPISSQPVYFSFQKTKKGEKAVKLFNTQIEKMRENGELTNLFEQVKQEVGEKYKFTYDPSVP